MASETTYRDKIIKFLPTFIDTNSNELVAIVTAAARSFYELYQAIVGLKTVEWTGKGLKLTAKENRMIYLPEITDADLQTKLLNRYGILTARGTEDGIADDIANIDLGQPPTLEFHSFGEVGGWTLDDTYPEVDPYGFLDVAKAIKLNLNLPMTVGYGIIGITKIEDSYINYLTAAPKEILDTAIIPVDVSIIYE
ncbi:MAG: hypothetical protein RDU14_16790 [Melioribacteraceae bacterium]|nr:hypothetical protein [Melioribacteraceae bacterium]